MAILQVPRRELFEGLDRPGRVVRWSHGAHQIVSVSLTVSRTTRILTTRKTAEIAAEVYRMSLIATASAVDAQQGCHRAMSATASSVVEHAPFLIAANGGMYSYCPQNCRLWRKSSSVVRGSVSLYDCGGVVSWRTLSALACFNGANQLHLPSATRYILLLPVPHGLVAY